jgi:hypothetical protein
MRIAVDLSRLVLRLYSTPWLNHFWTWQDFEIENGRIFVKSNMDRFRQTQQAISSGPPAFWNLIGEPLITRLGFALIETAFGRRLSEMKDLVDPSTHDIGDLDVMDFMTAKYLQNSGRVMEEAGRCYNDAVKACLEHTVFTGDTIQSLNSTRSDFLFLAEKFILNPVLDGYESTWGTLYHFS